MIKTWKSSSLMVKNTLISSRSGNWFAYDMHQFEDTNNLKPVEIPAGNLAV